ncbi:hypothetical protein H4R19_002305 [Coemansia spiralis]|nr:hypothetical protein H4R19_002305 [Coemansia spiralis]
MAAGSKSSAAGKVAALKHKLGAGAGRTKKPKASGTAGGRQQQQKRAKLLVRAATGGPDALGIVRASTKHSAGRKDLCRALDRKVVATQVGDMLRGIGGPETPTPAQVAQRALEARERAACAHERHQAAVNDTVDDLARLMSGA